MCGWQLLSSESGSVREPVSWLTNHPNLAQTLKQWREYTPGTEPDRYVQVKNSLASARYLVELVESFLRVVFRSPSNSQMWQHSRLERHRTKVVWQKIFFVDDVRGGVLEAERVKEARREEVHWCRGMGARLS